ncbi:MAG: pyridoxal-phosphate dependent enzyme [Deltaproteobacteria bacterium]|nr:pyridoxal-phosphate dependent enzyme [Deltaproteobacteria bacterium]
MIELVCTGCGAKGGNAAPYACPNSGHGDVDHVLSRRVAPGTSLEVFDDPNPFLRFRSRFFYSDLARGAGLDDAQVVEVARGLDESIARVDGHGFRDTPVHVASELTEALGVPFEVILKDETQNVSGSHKARHLMGVALHLEIAERLKLRPERGELAISSCGNAALGAAVVARAANRDLRVFVPTWADAGVVEKLISLGAKVEPCERTGGAHGDPCTLRMREVVRAGAVPFSCQGSDNGLAIEGGMTLGLELATQAGILGKTLDRIFVQVGGGALLSSTIQALHEAKTLGMIDRLPRIHAVQAAGAAPLARAHGRLLELLADDEPDALDDAAHGRPIPAAIVDRILSKAASHRSRLMWPWDDPSSIAHGILDDETYDWLWILRGMLETGGRPVTVSEELLLRANELGRRATGIRACATGTSGLAGLIAHQDQIEAHETVALLFTGRDRTEQA